MITIYAGTGGRGSGGDGGTADRALLNNPSGIALDQDGNLYISEFENNRIRRVDVRTHVITTVAGDGTPKRVDVQM
jgi:sugar lactone lactonase YvrE